VLAGLIALRALSRVAPESVGVVSPRPDDRVGPRRVTAAFALGVGWFLAGTGIAAVTHDLRLYENTAGVAAEARSVLGTGLVGDLLERVLLLFWSAGDVVVTGLGVVAAAGLVSLLLTREIRDPSPEEVSAD
jgi:MFS family permease